MAKSSVAKIIACAAIAGLAIVGASIGMGVGIKKSYKIGVTSNIEQAQFEGEGTYKVGDKITLEAKEVDGYRFVYWQFKTLRVSTENPYTFKLTKKNGGSYSAVYEKIYSISKADTVNGSITLSVDQAITRESVNVTVTPDENYELDNLYYIAESEDEHVNIENNRFNMPSKNVTVYATFKLKEYTLVEGDALHGTLSLETEKSVAGNEIIVNVTPDTGYKVVRVYYEDEDENETDIEYNEGYKFIMPQKDIIVYAEFELDQ